MPPGRRGPGTTRRLVPGLATSAKLLVATGTRVFIVDPGRAEMVPTTGLEDRRPTCLAADLRTAGVAWCGTDRSGVFRSDDGGASWRPAGLAGWRIMSLAVSPSEEGVVWAGTEPSQVWRRAGARAGPGARGSAGPGAGAGPSASASASASAGAEWASTSPLERLPSSSEWSFPPKPDTHHVRWIACHPARPGMLWVAVEAGALVTTTDGGRTWQDRVPDGPFDTHELAVHPAAPELLRVAAGDGYYESDDGGATWSSPRDGLDVGYLRSVAIAPERPDVVVVSAASSPRTTYMAGRSDGRVYRRQGPGGWERVRDGWPDPPGTIAPLLRPGAAGGELWAADERGVHRSEDGGVSWRRVAGFPEPPSNLRGLVLAGKSAG